MADAPIGAPIADFVERPGEVYVAKTELKAGALNLLDVLFQNITHIAPAIAGFFFTQFVVSLAGASAVLAYLIGVLVVLGLGICLAILAKHFPSELLNSLMENTPSTATGCVVKSVVLPESISTTMQSNSAAPGPKQHCMLSRTKTNCVNPLC